MSKYSKFIKRPLTETLEKAVWETSALDAGFATKYLLNYILDSAFLQICGALEQKVKCIYWELGSNNYELRYEILRDKIGECSNYKDKNEVLKTVSNEILKHSSEISISQKQIWDKIKDFIQDKFYANVLKIYFQKEYREFCCFNEFDKLQDRKKSKTDNPNTDMSLLNGFEGIKKIYNKVINYRNSIAHNTKSVLNNLPDFEILRSDDYKYENPFLRIAIMLLVDRTFIEVYEQYETCLKNT